MSIKTFTSFSFLAFALLSTACAPKEFNAVQKGEVGLSNLGGDATATAGQEGELPTAGNGTQGQGGGNTSGGNGGAGNSGGSGSGGTPDMNSVYPQITMYIPTCTTNQLCDVQVFLNRTDAKAVGYTWETDDTRYKSDPGYYAQPNVHYKPAAGTVYFDPGTTQRQMQIQTLSGFTQIYIPFQFYNCTYDNKPVDCSAFNFKLIQI